MDPDQSKKHMEELVAEAKEMRAELAKLNRHKFVRAYDSLPSLLLYMFLKGAAFGLGSVVGATILVSLLVYIVSQIELLPIIGEWVRAILDIVKQPPE